MTLGFFGPATLSRSQAILQSTTCSKPHDDSPPRMIARLRGLGNRHRPRRPTRSTAAIPTAPTRLWALNGHVAATLVPYLPAFGLSVSAGSPSPKQTAVQRTLNVCASPPDKEVSLAPTPLH